MIALQSIAIVWLGGGSIAMLIACIITSRWFMRLRSRIRGKRVSRGEITVDEAKAIQSEGAAE